MSQVVQLSHAKLTLLSIEDQTMKLEPPENFSQVLFMFLVVPASYQDIIHVAESPLQPGQHIIHHTLEGLPSVA